MFIACGIWLTVNIGFAVARIMIGRRTRARALREAQSMRQRNRIVRTVGLRL
jgi:hypothetical protein